MAGAGLTSERVGDGIRDLDLANALDAIYAYATEPLNWEEMARLLTDLDAAADEDAREVVEGLRLHVVRAETLARRLHDGQLFAEPVPGFCHVLVGSDQRVLDISTAAATLFEPFCGPLAVGKSLQFLDPENAAQYRAVLNALDASNGPLPPLLRLVCGEGNDGQFVYVVRQERLHKGKTETTFPQSHGGGIVLLMPDHAARDPQHVLFGGMGLTPAEMRIAVKLKEGLSLKDAAEALNIAVSTARNQLKSIFEKLNINRQSDLVRHLTELGQLAAYVRSGAQAADASSLTGRAVSVGRVIEGAPRVLFELGNGRKLAFRTYGQLDGIPVVLLQSVLGSSLVWPGEAATAARCGIRLIALERPGTGLSTFDPELSFESFAVDFEEFLDAQKIDSAYLWARSSSALFGLAAAARLGPRVRRLMLCSARFGVPSREGRKPSMIGYYFGHLARNLWLLEATLSILSAKISRPLLRGMAFHFFERSPPDAELFSRMPDLLQFKVESVIEALSQGVGGLVRETKLFSDEAEIDLTNLAAPVVIWHGELDGIIPVTEMLQGLKSLRFTPEEVRVISGGGHTFTIAHFDKAIARLLA